MTDKTNNAIEILTATNKLIEFMGKKRYTLNDIGLKSKQAFDWTKAGLFLEERESKFRRKYNAIEYVWLKIIKELREFGLSINAIKNLKSFLLKEVDMKEIINSFIEIDLDDEDSDVEELQTALKNKYGSAEGIKKMNEELDDNQPELVNTVLSMIIVETVINKSNSHLLITKMGNTIVTDGEPFDDQINLGDILNAPYISFPIKNILVDFINREDLMNSEEREEILLTSEEEEKVLELLRHGNLVSLSVRFNKDNEISLIETEENIELEKVQGKLADFIMRNKYQVITYKTQDGKITSMRRKTLHK